MVIVLARIKVKRGKEAQLEQAIREILPEVAKEQGTLTYVLHKSQNDPTRFMFFEQYQDMAALGVHSTTPHFKKLTQAMKECLEGKPEIELYDEVASGASFR